jgi:hypothetical protein
MKHTVSLNPQDYLDVRLVGSISIIDAIELGKKTLSLFTQMEDSGRKVKCLIDATNEAIDRPTYPTTVVDIIIGDLSINKYALFSTKPAVLEKHRQEIKKLKPETAARIKLFDNRASAEAWLLE